MEALDGCVDCEVAVATDRRVARRHCHAADGHCMSRQIHSQQQMAAAEAPIRGTGNEQRDEHDERSACDQHASRDTTRRDDLIGRRTFGDRGGIGREQGQQRRRLSLRLAALAIEIRPDATVFVRQPLFENVRAVIASEPAQRPPQQRDNDAGDQQADCDATGDRNRGRESLRCRVQTVSAVTARIPPIATAAARA